MLSDDAIWARHEFDEAYNQYTQACHNLSIACTEEEKKRRTETLRKASARFDESYKNLKAVQERFQEQQS